MNDFNSIAPYYDRLSRLVFGEAILLSQIVLLDRIASEDNVLIIGGGSGDIISYVPKCRRLVYLEKSEAFLRMAKEKDTFNKVEFVRDDFMEWTCEMRFDVIICPFFLDCFSHRNLVLVLERIRDITASKGKLIVADFERLYHYEWLLWLMHRFFEFVSKLDATRLLPIHQLIQKRGFRKEKELRFRKGFIFSRSYIKN